MKAVVAYISFFENELKQVVVDVVGQDWKEAYRQALPSLFGKTDEDFDSWILSLPEDLEEARNEMGDGEMDISVVFIG